MTIFEAKYKNGAIIRVKVVSPPKNWIKVEPKDVIRLKFQNKQYKTSEEMIMRPDEALTVISLLSEAIHYYLGLEKTSNILK